MPIYRYGKLYGGVNSNDITKADLVNHANDSTVHFSDTEKTAFNTALGADLVNASFINQLFSMFSNTANKQIPTLTDTSLTIESLDYGIYRVNTRAMRQALTIPESNYLSGPPNATDTYLAPGGILMILDLGSLSVFGTVVSGSSSTYNTLTNPVRIAVFFDAQCEIYVNIRKINTIIPGQTTTYNYRWSGFRLITTEYTKSEPYRGILTISTEVTATYDNPLMVFGLLQQFLGPWTAGYIIGPTCAKLTKVTGFTGNAGGLGTAVSSGTTPWIVYRPNSSTTAGLVFPPGQYYFELTDAPTGVDV